MTSYRLSGISVFTSSSMRDAARSGSATSGTPLSRAIRAIASANGAPARGEDHGRGEIFVVMEGDRRVRLRRHVLPHRVHAREGLSLFDRGKPVECVPFIYSIVNFQSHVMEF